MALGLPVVSTNVGGLPYLISNNIDGVLVDKEQPILMANQIHKIIKENKSSFANKARSKAENFDWSVVRNQWLKLLQ